MSVERTRFRHAHLSALRRGRHYLMRQVGPRSRCAQCGLPRCSPLHLLPLRPPPECQIPAMFLDQLPHDSSTTRLRLSIC